MASSTASLIPGLPLRAPLGRFLVLGLLALLQVPVAANGDIEYKDDFGVHEDGPPAREDEGAMKPLEGDAAATATMAEEEKLADETLLEFKDVDGDLVEIKREDGFMHLYGNGKLALEKIYLTKLEDRTLFFRSMPGTSTEHVDGETTIPKGQDQVLERAKELLTGKGPQLYQIDQLMQQAQAQLEEGAPTPLTTTDAAAENARRVEEFTAVLKMVAQSAIQAAELRKQDGQERKPTRGTHGLFIDVGTTAQNVDQAPAVASEEDKGIVISDPYRSVLALNRFNFNANILREGGGDAANHWIVLFCYSWWEPCKRMEAPYAQMGAEWQRKLNTALFTQEVRFAHVDCATDRVLCNERGVEGFPHVQHYTGGALAKKWSGGQPNDELRLEKWLKKRFADLASAEEEAPSSSQGAQGGGDNMSWAEWLAALPNALPGNRVATDLLLVLAVLALNLRAVCSNPSLYMQQPQAASAAAASEKGEPGAVERGPRPVSQPPTAAPVARRRSSLLPPEWAQGRAVVEL
jgi:thioredoxin-like negative regulator of GroEL